MDFQLKDYFKRFGFNPTKSAIVLECYGTELQRFVARYDNNAIKSYAYKNQCVISIPDNILETVSIVNKMVKHESCQNNFRNKFYSKKHNLILHLYDNGMVDKVLESENNYNFIIGKYSFHQPKEYFKNRKIVATGTEEYKPTESDIPFDWNEYKKTINGITVLIHSIRENNKRNKLLTNTKTSSVG